MADDGFRTAIEERRHKIWYNRVMNLIAVVLAAVTLATGDLPKGSKLLKGSCTTPDGKYTYLVHTIARYWLPVTQVDRGWAHNAALSVFDAKSGKYLNTVLLDDIDLGAAEPWDVIADEKEIVVAHSGSSELSFIDRKAFERKLEAAMDRDLSTDMSFMSGIRRRQPTPRQGPRKLKFQDGKAIVTDYLEDRPGVTEGELRFNDARLCFQQWHSCATCHPDGRSDGYEWSFPNADGLGRPEVSCDLAKIDMKKSARRGRMATDIEIALFAMPDKEKVKAMTAYVESLGAKACGETRK